MVKSGPRSGPGIAAESLEEKGLFNEKMRKTSGGDVCGTNTFVMRLLLLTASTGGGHDMRARSFAQWAQRDPQGTEVVVHQTLESTAGLYRFGVGLYNWIQRTAPRLHHLYFNWLEIFRPCGDARRLVGRETFASALRAAAPDAVISVHGSLNHGFFEVVREVLGPRVPRITYCGELFGGYGFSKNWVNPKADLFIGAVPEICDAARALGMPESRIWCGGFMLNPDFYEADHGPDARDLFLRETLGLDPVRPTLLLSTGAVGANNHADFVRALESAGLPLQVLAVCGRNTVARTSLATLARSLRQVKLTPLGYRDDMRRIMQSVTAIVARPGTGTTSEAVMAGCPILFNGIGGVMPQEGITLKWAKLHGLGALIRKATDLVPLARALVEQTDWAKDQRAKLSAVLPQQSPLAILEKCRSLIR